MLLRPSASLLSKCCSRKRRTPYLNGRKKTSFLFRKVVYQIQKEEEEEKDEEETEAELDYHPKARSGQFQW